jgi:hypothetical protein
MLNVLQRLYQRDVASGTYRATLVAGLCGLAISAAVLLVLSRLPFREVVSATGVVEPAHLESVRAETAAVIGRNDLRLGVLYQVGTPVLVVHGGEGASTLERVYSAPCRCVILRSELLNRSIGPVRPGELIAEFADPDRVAVRFALPAQWRGAVAIGGADHVAVHVIDDRSTSHAGMVTQIYPRRGEQLGLEAVATVGNTAGIAAPILGSAVTIRFEAPPVPLWRFFVTSLGR